MKILENFRKASTFIFLTTFSLFLTHAHPAEHENDFPPQKILQKCYVPSSTRAHYLIKELKNIPDDAYTAVSLEGCSFLFSNDEKGILFDMDIARDFSDKLPNWVEILDLSENRFPESLLICMSSLLAREKFRFLDVRLNSGADSLGAIRSFALHDPSRFNTLNILRKIIWLQENFLDCIETIPDAYKEAHREYFAIYKEPSQSDHETQWSFPES